MEHTTFTVPVRAGTDWAAEAATSLYHALQDCLIRDESKGGAIRWR